MRSLAFTGAVLLTLLFSGCGTSPPVGTPPAIQTGNDKEMIEAFTKDTPIQVIQNASVFGDYGRLIFPVVDRYYSGDTLEELGLTWYTHIDPDKTVEIVNYLKEHAEAGETVFL